MGSGASLAAGVKDASFAEISETFRTLSVEDQAKVVEAFDEVEEVSYDLFDPSSFKTFVVDADIRLVRGEYLLHLLKEGQLLPRRQEAEDAAFVDDSGAECSALVTHAELSKWESEDDASIMSVSHCWESQEHPDPCGSQLTALVNYMALHRAAYGAPLWLFYDYMSLCQDGAPEQSHTFRKALSNMHVFYSHEWTYTLRIESTTPESSWRDSLDKLVPVYLASDASDASAPSGLTDLPLRDLTAKKLPFSQRGWCHAELEWSNLRSDSARNRRIEPGEPAGKDRKEADAPPLLGRTPLPPEAFGASLQDLEFARASDLEVILKLQRKLYHERVTGCRTLRLENLSAKGAAEFAKVLGHYPALVRLELLEVSCGEDEARDLAEAIGASLTLEVLRIKVANWDGGELVAKALAVTLRANSFLREIDLAHNWLGAEGCEALSGALRFNTTLTHLNLRSCGIDASSCQVLAQGVRASITHLNLEFNRLKDGGCEALAEALKDACVQELNLACNQICRAGCEALAEALKLTTSLTHVNLKFNFIKDGGCQALAEGLKVNSCITDLNLASNQIGGEGCQALAEALKVNTCLREINLGHNESGDEGSQALAAALNINSTVTHLNLANNLIDDKGYEALWQALDVNTTVVRMSLLDNEFHEEDRAKIDALLAKRLASREAAGPEKEEEEKKAKEKVAKLVRRRSFERVPRIKGLARSLAECPGLQAIRLVCEPIALSSCQALGAALAVSTSVQLLVLAGNFLGDLGCQALAEALKVNRALTDVRLIANGIGIDGSQALAEALKVNTAVTTMDLRGNSVGNMGCEALAEALRVNRVLTRIALNYNSVGDAGCQAMAEALRENATVSRLELSGNSIGDMGCEALAETLKVNRTLTDVVLSFNHISSDGSEALAGALQVNSTLTRITLNHNSAAWASRPGRRPKTC